MTHRECPKCASTSISDSRQKPYERPLNVVCLKPYRCNKCDIRFWGFSDRQIRKLLPILKYGVGFLFCCGVIYLVIVAFLRTR